jgi:amino acid adenylation domain-containing protein
MWYVEQVAPNSGVNVVSRAIELLGPLDTRSLRQALSALINRHDALRTIFLVKDGQPVQVVLPHQEFELVVDDPQIADATERNSLVAQLTALEGRRPFDLSHDLPMRGRLLRFGDHDHVLLLTSHHIASDGWSAAIVYRELGVLYSAFVQAQPSPLPALPIQYADYAAWQREWLQGEVLEKQLAYWRQQLADVPILELPTDHPRLAAQTNVGAHQSLVLPSRLVDELKELGRAEGASLFMTLLSAFQVLLARHAGQADIAVGTPIAGRTHAEVEGLIGLFVNTLVLRTNLEGTPTFRELMNRVREVCLGAYAHQDVPFERLVEELRPERDLSRHPLVQVMFNLLNFSETDAAEMLGLTVTSVASGEPPSRLDLTLYAQEHNRAVTLRVVYNADLFDDESMVELLAQLGTLLEQAAQDPDRPIGDLSLVTPAGRSRLPDPGQPLSDSWAGAVHEIFAEHARQAPDRLAIGDAAEAWTYGELESRANRLAHALQAGGVQKGDVVAIYAARCAALACAVLGVLKAGAAFLILDPSYPPARSVAFLRIARPRAWLTVASNEVPTAIREQLVTARVGCCITVPPRSSTVAGGWLAEYPTDGPEVAIGPDDVACIAFTSGSMGSPKGVLGRHGSLSHFIPWLCTAFQLSEVDRHSMASGLAHDPLQRDIFTPLQTGASIWVPDPDELATPGRLSRWFRDHNISVANLTPGLLEMLVQPAPGAAGPTTMPALRRVFMIGDKLTSSAVERLRACAPSAVCVNLYGSTETQRALSYYCVPEPDHSTGPPRAIVPIGRGMRDVQLLVLNPAGRQAGISEVGEIHVRSPHLAHGYLDEPELTARQFVTNPYTGDSSDRVFRTGDLGRYLPDGTVEAFGRVDDQVKIRGFRVEPGEIEAALSDHPGIGGSSVVAHEWLPGDLRLVAYVVGTGGAEAPSVSELRRFLRERLPEYMVPAAFVPLAALPLTPNGKLDRRALPRPDPSHPELERGFLAPRSAREAALAAIWAELLDVERVGVRDNFFDLGGHSLLAVRLFARIYEQFGVRVPIASLFPEATVEHLSGLLDSSIHREATGSLVAIQPRGTRPPFFCVHPIDGEVVRYAQLARALGNQQPLYGLRARGLDDGAQPFTDIAEMAAYYVAQMRQVWPGPYQVGGFSSGGIVALEIANQLVDLGERVPLLVIFDTPFYRSRSSLARQLRGLPADLQAYLQHTLEPGQRMRFLSSQLRGFGRLLAWAIGARRAVPHRQGLESLVSGMADSSAPHHRVARLQLRALGSFASRPFRGRVALFRARVRPLLDSHDPTLGWDQLALAGVDVHRIPGDHTGIFEEPHVHVLARQLSRCLAGPTAPPGAGWRL